MTKERKKFKRVSKESLPAQPATASADKPARKKFARAGSSKIDHPHRDSYPGMSDEEFEAMIAHQEQLKLERQAKANGTANGKAGTPILAGIPTPPIRPAQQQPVAEEAEMVKVEAVKAEPTVAEPEPVAEAEPVAEEAKPKAKAKVKPKPKKPAATKPKAKKATAKPKRLVLKSEVKARVLAFLEGHTQEELLQAIEQYEGKGQKVTDEQYADCIDFLISQG